MDSSGEKGSSHLKKSVLKSFPFPKNPHAKALETELDFDHDAEQANDKAERVFRNEETIKHIIYLEHKRQRGRDISRISEIFRQTAGEVIEGGRKLVEKYLEQQPPWYRRMLLLNGSSKLARIPSFQKSIHETKLLQEIAHATDTLEHLGILEWVIASKSPQWYRDPKMLKVHHDVIIGDEDDPANEDRFEYPSEVLDIDSQEFNFAMLFLKCQEEDTLTQRIETSKATKGTKSAEEMAEISELEDTLEMVRDAITDRIAQADIYFLCYKRQEYRRLLTHWSESQITLPDMQELHSLQKEFHNLLGRTAIARVDL